MTTQLTQLPSCKKSSGPKKNHPFFHLKILLTRLPFGVLRSYFLYKIILLLPPINIKTANELTKVTASMKSDWLKQRQSQQKLTDFFEPI